MDKADRKRIAEIERQIVGEKPWQLKGEVDSRSRPLNSLLFEDVNFERRIKAPTITPESTEELESIIRQRIKDKNFDDPVRKTKPKNPSAPGQRQVEVTSEKSKTSLAQIYERDLLASSGTSNPENSSIKSVEKKLDALFRKLDALNEI